MCRQYRFKEVLEACPCGSNDNPFTGEVSDTTNTGGLRCKEQSNIGSKRHDGLDGVFGCPCPFAAHGKIGNCGIGEREFQFTVHDASDVFLCAFRGFCGHFPVRFGNVTVNDLGNCRTDDEKRATCGGSADTDIAAFCRSIVY